MKHRRELPIGDANVRKAEEMVSSSYINITYVYYAYVYIYIYI